MTAWLNVNTESAKRYMLKIPVQKRSRETVASIVESCARLLTTTPYHTITTDKIAEMAGVSIGSLYQFFANKEAIAAAVIDDLLQRDLEYLRDGLKNMPHTTVPEKVKAIIELGFSLFHSNVPLRTALQDIQGLLSYWETRRVFFEHYQKYILEHLPQLPGRDRNLVALIIVSTFNTAMHLSLQNPQDNQREAALKSELNILLERYLRTEN